MILTKGKRKVIFRGENYYWYIKKNEQGIARIHIISEDKKLRLEYGFDSELWIGTPQIVRYLEKYFETGGDKECH